MADGENVGDVSAGASQPEPLIRLSGVSKGFGEGEDRLQVLREIDFSLSPGDAVAVVGASGIGKSTLLHIMGTLDRPDEGKLTFAGRDLLALADEKLAAFRNRRIGFVFQFHHLLMEFTAEENVMMPVLVSGGARSKAVAAAREILSRVGLAGRFSSLVGEMSGGQQQRVALARALVMAPDVLLADEPTGNLDEKNSRQIHELLTELNREMGMTMVVVTHNMELAAMMKRRVTLAEGRLTAT